MKIRSKFISSFLFIAIFPLLVVGFFVGHRINQMRVENIFKFYTAQLYQVNNNVKTLIASVECDLESLLDNAAVTTRDDSDFTSFLNSDEKTFVYRISPKEKAIIDIFRSYQEKHPYVNSVYMGRENGSFVRSSKRPRPSEYDPRERPWYKSALLNQKKVMRTKPYLSVTSPDVNIGLVKAMTGSDGKVYGVVGIDITLERLSNFIEGVKVLNGSYLILIDGDGRILSMPDKKKLFKTAAELGIKHADEILNRNSGFIQTQLNIQEVYVFYYTSPEYGWKICAVVPEKEIQAEARRMMAIIAITVFFVIFISICVSYLLARMITRPFNNMMAEMRSLAGGIKQKAGFKKINLRSNDELQEVADTFNHMGQELVDAYAEMDDNLTRIKELDKLKSVFLSLVSHELRTPLTIIRGSLSLLVKSGAVELGPKERELVEMAQSNAGRLQVIIEDLLDVSKIESGVFTVKKNIVDAVKIVEDTIREIVPAAERKGISIIKDFSGEGIRCMADSQRISRVLGVVLVNAVKFSSSNTAITVGVKKVTGKEIKPLKAEVQVQLLATEYVLVSVLDRGIGIEKQHIDRIFEKFFQVEDTLTRRYQGAGIGLSIAKGIMRAHDGFVWADSEGLNKGSNFYIAWTV